MALLHSRPALVQSTRQFSEAAVATEAGADTGNATVTRQTAEVEVERPSELSTLEEMKAKQEKYTMNSEVQYLRLSNQTDARQMGGVLSARMEQRFPTFLDAMGVGPIANAAAVVLKANRNLGARKVLDLSVEDREKVSFMLRIQYEFDEHGF